jgi:hypothetical protein
MLPGWNQEELRFARQKLARPIFCPWTIQYALMGKRFPQSRRKNTSPELYIHFIHYTEAPAIFGRLEWRRTK